MGLTILISMALWLIRATKCHFLPGEPMQVTIDCVSYAPVCYSVAGIGIATTTLMALRPHPARAQGLAGPFRQSALLRGGDLAGSRYL